MNRRSEGQKALVWLGFVAAAMVVLAAVITGAIRQGLQATPPAAASPSLSPTGPAPAPTPLPRPGVAPTGRLVLPADA
jgi:hypothetical protein